MKESLQSKNYFVLIQLGGSMSHERLTQHIPLILAVLKRLSKNNLEQVLRSADASLFGYFLHTSVLSQAIRNEIQKSLGFLNSDALLIFEVGNDFTGMGFSRAWTWLQHRQ